MGVPIDLDRRQPRFRHKPCTVVEERRNSTFMAGNSLISSRGTMNGTMKLDQARRYHLPDRAMRFTEKAGRFIIWDQSGSYIMTVSAGGEVHRKIVEGGITNSNTNVLNDCWPFSDNRIAFLGQEDVVYFEQVEDGGVEYESLDIGKVDKVWLMLGLGYCMKIGNRLEIRDVLANNYSTQEILLLNDVLFVQCCANLIAIANKEDRVRIYEVPHSGGPMIQRHSIWIDCHNDNEHISQLKWSWDGAYLCIVTTHRILVYDTTSHWLSIVSGNRTKCVEWGRDNKIFLLAQHLYSTVLECLEYDKESKQWICCGFEDLRSQFHISQVSSIFPCQDADKIAVFHNNTLDMYNININYDRSSPSTPNATSNSNLPWPFIQTSSNII